ncbi:MAG: histidine phosphatase family protein [Fimbriimonadaceae bacterium]|nr:histidine phosphatase family protein [Chitinophagales bacterium]
MKTLYIIRHAKSSWEYDALHDLERPLTERGINDAAIVGNWLHEHDIYPGAVITSPALRALTTARIICDIIGFDKNKIILHADLYFKEIPEIVNVIREKGMQHDNLFIFGHNPTFSNLAHAFTKTFTEMMPTCGIVAVEFDSESWQLVELTKGKLKFFEYPKKYR